MFEPLRYRQGKSQHEMPSKTMRESPSKQSSFALYSSHKGERKDYPIKSNHHSNFSKSSFKNYGSSHSHSVSAAGSHPTYHRSVKLTNRFERRGQRLNYSQKQSICYNTYKTRTNFSRKQKFNKNRSHRHQLPSYPQSFKAKCPAAPRNISSFLIDQYRLRTKDDDEICSVAEGFEDLDTNGKFDSTVYNHEADISFVDKMFSESDVVVVFK